MMFSSTSDFDTDFTRFNEKVVQRLASPVDFQAYQKIAPLFETSARVSKRKSIVDNIECETPRDSRSPRVVTPPEVTEPSDCQACMGRHRGHTCGKSGRRGRPKGSGKKQQAARELRVGKKVPGADPPPPRASAGFTTTLLDPAEAEAVMMNEFNNDEDSMGMRDTGVAPSPFDVCNALDDLKCLRQLLADPCTTHNAEPFSEDSAFQSEPSAADGAPPPLAAAAAGPADLPGLADPGGGMPLAVCGAAHYSEGVLAEPDAALLYGLPLGDPPLAEGEERLPSASKSFDYEAAVLLGETLTE